MLHSQLMCLPLMMILLSVPEDDQHPAVLLPCCTLCHQLRGEQDHPVGLKRQDLQDGFVEKIILLWAECILDQEVSG